MVVSKWVNNIGGVPIPVVFPRDIHRPTAGLNDAQESDPGTYAGTCIAVCRQAKHPSFHDKLLPSGEATASTVVLAETAAMGGDV